MKRVTPEDERHLILDELRVPREDRPVKEEDFEQLLRLKLFDLRDTQVQDLASRVTNLVAAPQNGRGCHAIYDRVLTYIQDRAGSPEGGVPASLRV